MYFFAFIYLALNQDSVNIFSFKSISLLNVEDSIEFVVDSNRIAFSKPAFQDIVLNLDSTYQYTLINNQVVGTNNDIRLDAHKMIKSYFSDRRKNRLSLGKLRKYSELHDFMFYFAGLERLEFKEYFKAEYNLRQSYLLGIRTNRLKNELKKQTTKKNK